MLRGVLSLIFVMLVGSLGATTYYVATTGNDANAGTASGSPKATIQDVFDDYNLASGDIISVAAGTYSEDAIWVGSNDEGFSIVGAGSGSTIFDGDNGNYWMYVSYDNCDDITIQDLKVKDMQESSGAIQFRDNCTGWNITNVVFENCEATSGGGAALNFNSTGDCGITITGCTFTECTVTTPYDGAAIRVDLSTTSMSISKCIFYNNEALSTYGDGSALSFEDDMSSLTIENCLFYENTAYRYGVIYDDEGATITNCTFADNVSSTSYGGLYLTGGVTSTVKNCIITDNSSTDVYVQSGTMNLSYSQYDIHYSATLGSGTTTSSPTFVDAAGDDYQLASGSVGIDAGTDTGAPSDDLLSVTRTGTTDMGAYEFACPSAVWDGSSSTAWATDANWDIGEVPCGDITIPDVANQPVVTTTVSIGAVTINSGADLTITSNSLTMTGALDNDGTIYIDNATLNADGDVDATGGNIDFTNTNGKLIVSSTVTSLGTLDVAAGTVEYDDANAQTIAADTYYNLELDGDGSGAKSAGGTIVVNGNFTVGSNAEKFNPGANTITVTGTTDIDSELELDNASSVFNADGALDASGGTIDFTDGSAKLIISSTVTSLGTLDDATGTVEYDGSTQDVAADTYYNLEIDQAGTKTAQGTVNVAGTLTVQSAATYAIAATTNTITGTADVDGTLSISTGTFTANGSSDIDGTVSVSSTGTYDANAAFDATSGNVTFTGAGTLAVSSTVTSFGTLSTDYGTIKYDGTTQTIVDDTYSGLTLDQSGTKTAGSNLVVTGDVTTSNGAFLDMSIYDLTVGGNLTIGDANSSDFEESACMITFDGSSDQTYTHAGNATTVVGATLISHDFESDNGWSTGGSVGGMSFSRTSSPSPFNGDGNATTVWTHSPFNNYGSSDAAYVESPSIDMTNWTSMTFSIDIRYNTESGYDGAVIFWSTDNFSSMTRFGSNGEGTNWYNNTGVDGPNDRYAEITTDPHGWSGDNSAWQTASRTCPVGMEGESNVKFRVYFGTDGSAEDDGFAFDNVIITGTEAGSGSGSEISNFTVNKSGGDLILGSAIEVDGTATFTAGDLDASTNAITFADAGAVSGGSTASHIKGTVNKTTESTSAFTFPIGDGSDYEPVTITPSSGSSTSWTLTYTVATHGDTDMGTGLNNISTAEYWDLSRNSGSADATVAFNWDSNDGVVDYADLTIAHYNSVSGEWEVITSTPSGNNTSGTITSDAAVTSFSPFAKGSLSADNPLPVDLISLEANCEEDNVLVEWITATEINNDYFLLEKADDSGIYDYLGEVGGNGTSTEMHEYSYTDYDYDGGVAYYRLTQYDFDGEFEMFNAVSVQCNADEQPKGQMTVATNKLGGYLNIQSSELGENVFYELRVYDASGKQIYMGEHFTESGSSNDNIQISSQAAGIYIIQLNAGNVVISEKVSW